MELLIVIHSPVTKAICLKLTMIPHANSLIEAHVTILGTEKPYGIAV
jgi:hypothetical protein